MLIGAPNVNSMLVALLVVMIIFIVLLTVLGIVFIVALRKRAPVIKVVMAPRSDSSTESSTNVQDDTDDDKDDDDAVEEIPSTTDATPDAEDEGEDAVYVTEGKDRVRYDRSFEAKVIQLKDETKEWYNELKNELLSYTNVRSRMSWKREAFRIGRNTVARLMIRGKTLCLLLAVEPDGYDGTKYTVEDVSKVATTADTPCQYRIKSARRLKYAKEMLAGIMKELNVKKQPGYQAEDFYLPYEGTMGLMQRGLVKRIVSGSTRVFKVQEVDGEEAEGALNAEATTPVQGENSQAVTDAAKEVATAAVESKAKKGKK